MPELRKAHESDFRSANGLARNILDAVPFRRL
jgi:hypothetical protein